MNKKIEELARWAVAESGQEFWWLTNDLCIEKFAQLIAMECAGICMEMSTKCAGTPGDGALAKDCADWIMSDFGIDNE